MREKKKSLLVLASVTLWCGLLLGGIMSAWAAETLKEQKGSRDEVAATAASVDFAAGILDAGKLQHTVYNNGLLASWGWSGYVIPDLPAGWFKGYGYVPDLVIFLGIPEGPWTPKYWNGQDSVSMGPTVSEAQLQAGTTLSDWDPTPGSLGDLHSGDVTIGDVIPGAPMASLPLMATSTIETSWPEDAEGNRFWPGPWAVDPGPDGIARTEDDVTLEGTFTADKEVFFSFTDDGRRNPGDVAFASRDERPEQGYPIGAQVDVWTLSYGRSYAEDFLFFPCKLINTSDWHYKGVYVSFYLDVDVEEYRNDTDFMINDRMDWMGFTTREWEPDLQDTIDYNMAYIFDYRPEPNWRPHVGIKLLETPADSTGRELGLTDWHWFEWENRPGVVIPERQELIQYKLMSGDNTKLQAVEDAAYFHKDAKGKLNPHFDSPENIQRLYPNGTDCVFMMSSGPFDWAPRDTTTFSFCLIMGEGRSDMKMNARTAQLMYDLNYLGANPPPSPTVTAVPGDGKVTLYWDEAAESATDIMTGYADFEGYKIYRTTTEPSNNEWGQKIYDGYGQEVGFVPLAQFDVNDQIRGLDPEYPFLNLGSDVGLVHSWTDETALNGVTYWYSVTSYDRGVIEGDTMNNPDGWASLNYLECAKGSSPGFKFGPNGAEKLTGSSNLVQVVPGAKPAGWVNAESPGAVEPLPGTQGNAPIEVTVLDPYAVTGHSYIISFEVTTDGDTLFNVRDEMTGQDVLLHKDQIRDSTLYTDNSLIPPEKPVFDGFGIRVFNWSKVHFWKEESSMRLGSLTDSTNMDFAMSPFVARPCDYKVVFTEAGSTSRNNVQAPFEVYNLTEGTSPSFEVQEDAATANRVWDDGEPVRLWEPNLPTWTLSIFARPDTTGFEDIDGVPGPDFDLILNPDGTSYDTLWHYTYGDTLPLHTSDTLYFVSAKPYKDGDALRIQTKKYMIESAVETALDSVRVVPNPYVINAEWELNANRREIHFTHIPAQCDIHIYTLTGEPVRTIHHDNAQVGWASWDLLTENRQLVSYGLYIYVVKTPDGRDKIGKFAIIQ